MAAILYSLCTLFFSGCESPYLAEPLSQEHIAQGQRLIELQTEVIDEASGLTAATTNGQLWFHNDSGGEPEIFLVDTETGALNKRVSINGAQATDWEDMARYTHNGEEWLLIADVGDNNAIRPFVTLYAFPEPNKPDQTEVDVALSLNFRYEDGPRDCEAVAIDGDRLLLLTKRDTPPRLYQLPLAATTGLAVAEFIGEVTSIPAPTEQDLMDDPEYGEFRSQPTAMDLSPDGHQLLITTYKDSYLYQRHSQGWPAALAEPPTTIDVPQMAQTEAGGFSTDGKAIWVASEQLPTQLFYTPIE